MKQLRSDSSLNSRARWLQWEKRNKKCLRQKKWRKRERMQLQTSLHSHISAKANTHSGYPSSACVYVVRMRLTHKHTQNRRIFDCYHCTKRDYSWIMSICRVRIPLLVNLIVHIWLDNDFQFGGHSTLQTVDGFRVLWLTVVISDRQWRIHHSVFWRIPIATYLSHLCSLIDDYVTDESLSVEAVVMQHVLAMIIVFNVTSISQRRLYIHDARMFCSCNRVLQYGLCVDA